MVIHETMNFGVVLTAVLREIKKLMINNFMVLPASAFFFLALFFLRRLQKEKWRRAPILIIDLQIGYLICSFKEFSHSYLQS